MVHPHDSGKRRLLKLVNSAPESSPRLPITHTTDTYRLTETISDGALTPQDCPVFDGEALTYFFYGRPSFRPNVQENPSGLSHYFPIVLLFNFDKITHIKRIFPFDSGACDKGYYSAYLHKNMKLGDFALEPDHSTPGRMVSLFFGNVPAYLSARPTTSNQFDPAEFEAASFEALINAKDSNSVDSRGSGIEIQSSEPIPLKDHVQAVVLPAAFAEQSTGSTLKALGIDILAYRTYERMRPNEYLY